MPSDITPASGSGPAYRAQYKVTEQTKKFWEKLFHTHLTDEEVQQMTDTFVKNVCQAMSQCTSDAIKNMKRIEQEMKEAQQ